MLFSDLRIKNMEYVVRYTPHSLKFSAQNRRSHIIGLKLSGKANHIFENRRFMMEEDCIYFLNQREDYKVETESIGQAFSVHFTTFLPVRAESFCIKLQDSTHILHLLEGLEQLHKSGQMNSARAVSTFYRLLDQFEEIYYKKYAPKNADLAAARDYLLAHFKEKGCIDAAAAQVGVSRRRFNDLFKAQFDIAPNQFLIDHKIALAKKMLAAGELSVQEIAEFCGFADVYYFSRLFKKETGLPPTDYRKNK